MTIINLLTQEERNECLALLKQRMTSDDWWIRVDVVEDLSKYKLIDEIFSMREDEDCDVRLEVAIQLCENKAFEKLDYMVNDCDTSIQSIFRNRSLKQDLSFRENEEYLKWANLVIE